MQTLIAMFKFYPKPIKSPADKQVRYYPAETGSEVSDLKYIIERIQKESTVASADVKAVIDALQTVIISELQQGRKVHLGDIGSFRLTITGKSSETAEECTAANIRDVRVRFSQSAAMRTELVPARITFERLPLSMKAIKEMGKQNP